MVTGSDGKLLGHDLSGNLVAAEYRVTSNITVEVGNTLIIEPGSILLFEGNCEFIVEGILKAQGTESDSIIFDNCACLSSYTTGSMFY